MKSTQRVSAPLQPYICFRNRQGTEVGFPNAACYSSHSVGGFTSHSSSSSTWKYALVTSAVNVKRRLGTQVVDDASRARSGARRKHIVHCFNTLELSRKKMCTDSVSPVVRSPACCHSLLAESCVHIHHHVHSTFCESCEFFQLGLRRLLNLRMVNKKVQQLSNVFMAVDILCTVLIFNSRYCDSSHCHTPNVHLRAFTRGCLACGGTSSVVGSAARLFGVDDLIRALGVGNTVDVSTTRTFEPSQSAVDFQNWSELELHVLRNPTRRLCR